MSKTVEGLITCPECSHQFPSEVYRSLWTEFPENLQLITEDRLNVLQCPKCSAIFQVSFAVMAVNKVKRYCVWYEPSPDPAIDEELPHYATMFGADSYYVQAPRIADWVEFKDTVARYESGELAAGTIDTSAFERPESPISVDESAVWEAEGLADRFLEELVQSLSIEPEWSVRSEKSIEWWSGPYRQVITMESADDLIAVQIRTDFARVIDGTYVDLLTSFSKFHSIAGFCRKYSDPAFWQLGSKLYITPETAQETLVLAKFVLAIQARHAYFEAGGLMKALQQSGKDKAIRSGASAHPQSGNREGKLPAYERLIEDLKAGSDDVHAVDDWFKSAVQTGDGTPYVLRTCDEEEGDFSYEYPFPNATSRLTGNREIDHRTLGPSIGVMSIFHALPDIRTAVAAQDFELNAMSGVDVLGSWQEGRDGFAHMSVVPYGLIRMGVGNRAFVANLERSSWITQDILGYGWEENLAEAQEFKRRSLEAFVNAYKEEEERRNRPGFFKRMFGNKG